MPQLQRTSEYPYDEAAPTVIPGALGDMLRSAFRIGIGGLLGAPRAGFSRLRPGFRGVQEAMKARAGIEEMNALERSRRLEAMLAELNEVYTPTIKR